VSRFRRVVFYLLLATVAGAAIAFTAILLLVQSAWFKNQVRERIISITENATGGRVEIGQFDFNWRTLTATIQPFVLHGKEPASSAPLFHAAKIEIGLKVISVLERNIDITLLAVEKPEVHVAVAPDGTTNLPAPKVARSQRTVPQQLLDLKIRHFALHNGFADYNDQKISLDLTAENLSADVRYDATRPRYTGDVALEKLRAASPKLGQPLALDMKARLALEKNQLRVESAHFALPKSSLDLTGVVQDLSTPRGEFDVAANLTPRDLNQSFRLPITNRGEIAFQGRASFSSAPFAYRLIGKVKARGLDYDWKSRRLANLSLAANIEVSPDRVTLSGAQLNALNGTFQGSAELRDWKRFTVTGVARNFPLEQLAALSNQNIGEFSGTVNGPIHAEGVLTSQGVNGLKVEAKLEIAPQEKGVPVEGAVALNYDQRAGRVELGSSHLRLRTTRLTVSGTLGETLQVHLASENLRDLLPVFPLLGEQPPSELPIQLDKGSARFEGTVDGPLNNPRVSGNVDLTNFTFDHRAFDHLTASVVLTRSSAEFRNAALDQGTLHAQGSGRIGLSDWKTSDSSPISGALNIRGADLAKLLPQNEKPLPVSGTVSATLNVKGTLGSPQGEAVVQSPLITAYDEQLNRIRADMVVSGDTLQLVDAEASAADGRITAKGDYTHSAGDWKTGRVRFQFAGDGIVLERIRHVEDFYKGFQGKAGFQANGAATLVKGEFDLSELTGQAGVRDVTVDKRPYGSASFVATTDGEVLDIKGDVDLRSTRLHGAGKVTLSADYSTQAQIEIPRLTVATLHDLYPGQHVRESLPFDGFIQGSIAISGPLKKPDALKADVVLNTVQINANPTLQPNAGAAQQDLVLHNRAGKPVLFEATTKNIDIKSAEFEGKDTTVQATGKLSLGSKSPWDLDLNGTVGLAILRIFNPDLLASGNSVVKATVHGPFDEPQVDGHLEFKNASLFLKDVPNGVSEANGVILFDRSRATVQSLTGVTGGGRITFQPGSFVGFRGPALVYRLQADANNVRYRSAEGVSITVSATLSLTGTSVSSLLSGTMTVERAAFNPRTDVGALLASTEKPISATTTPNDYLRGIQFDLRVLTAQSLELQTSLTHDVQAEANIHIRGTLERPVVLGNISVSSGQIEFFGNKYTITRGEINFFNPTKIEPILNMDLETRVRAITVDISFSGSLDKLNFSYRSDPPFDSNQILALLAVGRDPTTTNGLAGSQTVTNTSYLATGSNALLGQAIAPVGGRLERFFGVSHIKIDPQFTDITTIPQARLTLEQQISKNVTLTYITNLTRTSEQIVRVEVDFSRRWAVVALRDENGAFGIDVQYRRRFK
jgi:translocation and assembly module TamB